VLVVGAGLVDGLDAVEYGWHFPFAAGFDAQPNCVWGRRHFDSNGIPTVAGDGECA
jgi:hypothetical protein